MTRGTNGVVIIYWGGGKWGGGGKRSFNLINRGSQKSFNAEKGGQKVFELKYHVYQVPCSDLYNHKQQKRRL